MSRDLEIDELTRKIESLQSIRQSTALRQHKRRVFAGVNAKQRDMFVSMNDENKYREFERWLLMKTI